MLLAVAHEADDQGKATLSLEDISALTGLTPRTVMNSLGELYQLGELAHTQGGGKRNPNSYSILLGSHVSPESNPEVGSGFMESSSESRKFLPGKEEVSSSRAGVTTPVGSSNTSKKQASLPRSSAALQSVDVPEGAQEVVAAMTNAGMLVGWRLNEDEWDRVTALSERWGAERLVEIIARRWDPAQPPKSARYLLRIWADLPSQGPTDGPTSNVVPLRRDGGWKPFRAPEPSAYQNGF